MGQDLSSLQKLSASKVATMTTYGKDLYLTFQKKKARLVELRSHLWEKSFWPSVNISETRPIEIKLHMKHPSDKTFQICENYNRLLIQDDCHDHIC